MDSGNSDMYMFQLLMGQLLLQLYDGLKAILAQEKLYLDVLSLPVLEVHSMCYIKHVGFYVLF